MLTWLGMRTDKKAGRQFFTGVEKKTIFLILLLSLAILKGVKWGMTALIPTAFFSDPDRFGVTRRAWRPNSSRFRAFGRALPAR